MFLDFNVVGLTPDGVEIFEEINARNIEEALQIFFAMHNKVFKMITVEELI